MKNGKHLIYSILLTANGTSFLLLLHCRLWKEPLEHLSWSGVYSSWRKIVYQQREVFCLQQGVLLHQLYCTIVSQIFYNSQTVNLTIWLTCCLLQFYEPAIAVCCHMNTTILYLLPSRLYRSAMYCLDISWLFRIKLCWSKLFFMHLNRCGGSYKTDFQQHLRSTKNWWSATVNFQPSSVVSWYI